MMLNLNNPYRVYIFIQLVVVALVVVLFKVIAEKQVAAVIASLLFIGSAIGILVKELKGKKHLKTFTFWGTCAFLLLSAFPIFLLRVFHWGDDFASLQLLGFSGVSLHKASSYFFILMLISYFIDASLYRIKTKSRD